MCKHLKRLQRIVLLSATLLHCCTVQMSPTRFCSTAARVVTPCAGIRSPHKLYPIVSVKSGVVVQKRSWTACCASEDDAKPFDPAAFVGSYEFAESVFLSLPISCTSCSVYAKVGVYQMTCFEPSHIRVSERI